MAPKRVSPALSSLFPIGDCEVVVEGKKFTCESGPKTLQISFSRNEKVNISVREEMNKESGNVTPLAKCGVNEDEKIVTGNLKEYMFLLVSPNDDDAFSKSCLQEVLKLYIKELPDMNYAANTRKQSAFLERCVSKSKYCTLILKSMLNGDSNEIIAAITYQIVPADTQYAEIPLAAVTAIHQKKGFGKLIYGEIKKRLQNVGVHAVFCWGDKESEGFWLKQGFISIAEVDQKGKASRLCIKANIRKALCFPGGSTLMVSHLKKESSANPANLLRSSLQLNRLDSNIKQDGFNGSKDSADSALGKESNNMVVDAVTTTHADTEGSSPGMKRTWEASLSSLKSKRVRGTHPNDCELDMDWGFSRGKEQEEPKDRSSLGTSADPLNVTCKENDAGECRKGNGRTEPLINRKTRPNKERHRILLMDIGNDNKRAFLTKVIEQLGGVVTFHGSKSTHIVTGKVRKTLNFCTALCSGAWIVSPTWLKESFREGSFANEASYMLHDEDYALKYRTELKSTVLRVKARPRSLLRGYDMCIGAHVQPPVGTLSAIIISAGGNVIGGLGKVKEASKTIFIASEDDMEGALSAVKKGIWTFSSDWLMNCVMRQELDLEAPQFAESL